MMKTVISGIRATGNLHLGNYLGAMRYFVELSKDKEKDCMFFIANLHTLTTRVDPESIKRDLKEIVLDFISVGLDPSVSTIFAQSSVPETCELNWLLSCITSVADLERMPHFKEKKMKKEEMGEVINAGLLTYPVLMAADILGPKAHLVPVGEDQHPHVELTRNLAKRFNLIYGETFPVPDLLAHEAVRVPGLNGLGKMGKSDNNTIDLSDEPKIIKRKISVAVTDTSRVKRTDPGNPVVCNMYKLHSLVNSQAEADKIVAGCASAQIGCVECKNILSKIVIDILAPIQEKRAEIREKKSDFISDILNEGGKRAGKIIAATVEEVKDKMGVPKY